MVKSFVLSTALLMLPGLLAAQGSSINQTANSSNQPARVTSGWALSATAAQEAIAKNPQDATAYAALAYALCQQGRATSDAKLYADADGAVQKAFQLSPNNFEAGKSQVCVELGRHEFARARREAMILNKRIPDDLMVYGLLVDANSALGNYPEAEDAAQWMLNLRPGNVPAFLHAADLREVFGEPQGALQLLKLVLDETSPADVSGRVEVLTQMAHVDLQMGNLSAAESLSQQALSLLPDSSRTLVVMAQVRLVQGRPVDSVRLLRQASKLEPRTETLYALAEVMESAGMKSDAETMYAEFLREANAESALPDNANRQLIFYYADHANKPAAGSAPRRAGSGSAPRRVHPRCLRVGPPQEWSRWGRQEGNGRRLEGGHT